MTPSTEIVEIHYDECSSFLSLPMIFTNKERIYVPWCPGGRRGAVVIASASRPKDPGSNTARLFRENIAIFCEH
jgi:NhaP-type Na+/H+ and K+/H+ antiporter